MNRNDSGFLISKNRYSENSIIAEIFTEHHCKVSGIIFGAKPPSIIVIEPLLFPKYYNIELLLH